MAEVTVHYDGPLVSRADAIGRGDGRYFTGAPCRQKHVAERRARDGRCCECTAANHAAWRVRNKDALAVYHAEWSNKNSSARAEYQAAYSEKNKAAIASSKAAYSERNKATIAAQRATYRARTKAVKAAYDAAYNEKNKERQATLGAAWREANQDKVRASKRNRRARKRAAEGSHTAAEIRGLLKLQRGKCAYCRVSLSAGYHVDHIIPLIKGGSNYINNIQLTCKRCNLSKQAKDPIEFAQQIGLLI